MAVNKDAIIEAVYQGAGQSENLIPPTMWGYNDAVNDYEYNPEKAKALLAEAGFRMVLKLTCGQCLFNDHIIQMHAVWRK